MFSFKLFFVKSEGREKTVQRCKLRAETPSAIHPERMKKRIEDALLVLARNICVFSSRNFTDRNVNAFTFS